MKKAIFRNIVIVSAIFVVTFAIMLTTNYFQVRGSSPLQVEVLETLKQLNYQDAGNPELQEQIRVLDLQARKAYFASHNSLSLGIYILLGMLAVMLICLRLLFAEYKNIPDKEIDPIDEWTVKSEARKYVVWGISGFAAVALVFAIMTSPLLKVSGNTEKNEEIVLAETQNNTEPNKEINTQETENEGKANNEMSIDTLTNTEDRIIVESSNSDSTENSKAITAENIIKDSTARENISPEPEISKVTHNGFRGNNSNGQTSAKGVPTKWNLASGTNIAWKHDIPRKGYNSPVINGNKVFFSGADEQARELYCYDLSTGEQLWKVAATDIPGSPSTMPKTTDDTGLAASTVATNGKQVCAIFATGDIICTDIDGKRLWAKNLGTPDNHYGYASSLLVFGNSLIVQYDNQNSPKVVSLDLATGNVRWSKDRAEKITWSSPIITYIDKKPQLVLMGNPNMTAYNPSNGEQLWNVKFLSGEVGSSPCSSNGLVFGASEYAKMVAVNGTDGSVLWESDEYLPEVASPVATKNNVFVATSYGVLAAFDAKTGELKKEHDLGTEFYSSPVLAEGRIYLFSNDGKMFIFSANDDCNLITSFDTGERTFATPAFTDGKIVVRTDKSIYCVTTN
ncbi:MAG: PQQ-binding-like beta-propeller repeat protein [Bacteroidales bacterium]